MSVTLTIVRGPSGSGKSTLIKEMIGVSPDKWFEADQFFTDKYNQYNWSFRFLPIAHDWCYFNTLQSLKAGHNVYVGNTFITIKELKRYFELVNFVDNLTIKVIEMHTQYKSIHNVPEEAIERIRNRWEEIPEDYKFEITKVLPCPN